MDGTVLPGRKRRVFRRVEEKLRIVKLTLEPGASVAGICIALRPVSILPHFR
jgi:transposase-like protein